VLPYILHFDQFDKHQPKEKIIIWYFPMLKELLSKIFFHVSDARKRMKFTVTD